jgi:hypothetical protein
MARDGVKSITSPIMRVARIHTDHRAEIPWPHGCKFHGVDFSKNIGMCDGYESSLTSDTLVDVRSGTKLHSTKPPLQQPPAAMKGPLLRQPSGSSSSRMLIIPQGAWFESLLLPFVWSLCVREFRFEASADWPCKWSCDLRG